MLFTYVLYNYFCGSSISYGNKFKKFCVSKCQQNGSGKDNVNDTLCVPNFGTFLMRKIQKTKMSVDVTGKGKRAMV